MDSWRQLGFVFHAATFLLAWGGPAPRFKGQGCPIGGSRDSTPDPFSTDWLVDILLFSFTFFLLAPHHQIGHFIFIFFPGWEEGGGNAVKGRQIYLSYSFRAKEDSPLCVWDTPTSSSHLPYRKQLIRKRMASKIEKYIYRQTKKGMKELISQIDPNPPSMFEKKTRMQPTVAGQIKRYITRRENKRNKIKQKTKGQLGLYIASYENWFL